MDKNKEKIIHSYPNYIKIMNTQIITQIKKINYQDKTKFEKSNLKL